MNSARIITAGLVCLAALLAGGVIGMAMGGFGICAVGLSPALVGSAAAVGALFSGSVAWLWPRRWWAGALAFSLPTLLGVAFSISIRDWQRVVGIGVSIAASFLVAFVVRFPGPSSLKR